MDILDILGNKARAENVELRKKVATRTLMYEQLLKELDTLKAHLNAINSANKSKDFYDKTWNEYGQKATDLSNQVRDLGKRSEVLIKEVAINQKKSDNLKKEIGEYEVLHKRLSADLSQITSGKVEAESKTKDLQKLQTELVEKLRKSTEFQQKLANGTRWMELATARIDRHEDIDTCSEAMLLDLQRVADEDKVSSLQLNLSSRPLLLVLDVGTKQTMVALVRGGTSFVIESQELIKYGAVDFEDALAEWLKNRFSTKYPLLKKTKNERFLPLAQRLFMLLCQGAPQGDIEETVVIDSHPYTATIPLVREELAPIFRPLLVEDGKIIKAIKKRLNNLDGIDRVVCLGLSARLLLFREALEVFRKPVFLPELIKTIAIPVEFKTLIKPSSIKALDNYCSMNMIASGLIEKLVFQDKSTGLMWSLDCNIAGNKMSCFEANNWLARLSYAGFNNWRLPTVGELDKFSRNFSSQRDNWGNINGFRKIESGCYCCNNNNNKTLNPAFNVFNVLEGKCDVNDKNIGKYWVWPVRDDIQETASSFKCNATGMEFVFINGGTFQMGDTFGRGESKEQPEHEVSVNSFLIGKYQVKQSEWHKIMRYNASYFKGDSNPVDDINWEDAQIFIKKLKSQTGKKYRLPTEAEWEYAARSGGKSEEYAGGNNLDAVAWTYDNSGRKTHPVGQKRPNGLGIYDMTGNVWEWCQDLYDANYYKNSPRCNPQGPSSGSSRVLRGGSWSNDVKAVRASFRLSSNEDERNFCYGLRLVLPPD